MALLSLVNKTLSHVEAVRIVLHGVLLPKPTVYCNTSKRRRRSPWFGSAWSVSEQPGLVLHTQI
jgi:hypothetical protein